MVTRLVLRLPWFVSTPTILLMAVVAALAMNLVAGKYFERTFLDEADPLAGIALPAAPAGTAAAVATQAPPTAATAVAGVAATPVAAASPVAGQVAPAQPATGPALLSEGQFVDGDPGHTGKGGARLIRGGDGAVTLRFENFSVTNGPDLFVILSTDPGGSRGSATNAEAVNLGGLKATDGNINYAVPAGTEVSKYRSVIIYCRAFKVVFATATLEAAQ